MLRASFRPPPALAVSIPRLPSAGRLSRFALDWMIVVGVMVLYFLGRAQAPTRIGAAVDLTTHLVNIERALGIFREPAVQAASIHYRWSEEAANLVYAYMHFPVIILVGIWLWWRSRERFIFMRNVMFVSMAIGMVFYYLLPAAPPRLMTVNGHNLGFVDTVFGGQTAVTYVQPSLFVNDYAAIPSFHFGWIALSAMAIWMNTENRTGRVLALALIMVMAWAVVASANHLFFDIALGGAVIAVSWMVVRRLTDYPAARRGAVGRRRVGSSDTAAPPSAA